MFLRHYDNLELYIRYCKKKFVLLKLHFLQFMKFNMSLISKRHIQIQHKCLDVKMDCVVKSGENLAVHMTSATL